MFQGIFLDTQDTDKRFAELMSTQGPQGLNVTFEKPRELLTQAQQIWERQPDLVALDYRLNDTQNQQSLNYKAGALAQQLRDCVMESVTLDFPIILVSNKDDINAFFDNVTANNLFDHCFSKEELGHSSNTSSRIILSLVAGYKQLIKKWNHPERWSTLLGLSDSEKIRVGYQAIRELDQLKAPHQVARDILHYVIDRPGLLLDQDNVLAELGIAKAGKDVDTLLEILHQNFVQYTGIFSEGWTRWWSHRLEEWGKALCDEHLGNLTARQRVSCLNKKLALNLSPAKSRWENHSDALFAFACDSCHQPTEDQYSVAIYDPLPYMFVRSKRICWKCVETGEFEYQGLEIDEDEESIVEMILNGEIRK